MTYWLYKRPELAEELASTPALLQQLLQDFARLSLEAGIVPTVTRVLDDVKNATQVHSLGRAVDLRDEQAGVFTYSPELRLHILKTLNEGHWARRDKYKSVVWHSFNDGPHHWHLQVAQSPSAYVNYPLNLKEVSMSQDSVAAVAAVPMSVKELSEALVGVNELSLALIPILKDGVQLTDAVSLAARIQSDEALRNKLLAAVEGISKVPAEVKDIDLREGLQLAQVQLGYLPAILAALKG